MIKKLRWVAITRAHRAATLGFALALVTAPAAYGADGNPWHINIYGANSARTNTVRATAYGADRNPWHINLHGDTSRLAALAALSTAPAAATAGAGTPFSVDVSGTQTVIDEAAGTFAMHGSLVGTWYNTKFVPTTRPRRNSSRAARSSSSDASTPTRTPPATRRSPRGI
jgi:hypothetical protein